MSNLSTRRVWGGRGDRSRMCYLKRRNIAAALGAPAMPLISNQYIPEREAAVMELIIDSSWNVGQRARPASLGA